MKYIFNTEGKCFSNIRSDSKTKVVGISIPPQNGLFSCLRTVLNSEMPDYHTKLDFLLSEHFQVLISLRDYQGLNYSPHFFPNKQSRNLNDAYRQHIQRVEKHSRVWWPHHLRASGRSRVKAKECDFRVVAFSLHAFTLFYIQKCLRNNKQKYFPGPRLNLRTCLG